MKIFTDGAATKNGKSDCSCGIGVYSSDLSVSMSLEECKKKWDWIPKSTKNSNNIGELLAIYAAIVMSKEDDIIIYSDSAYSINCVTKWHKNWKKNGWKTSKNECVKNKDIIEKILEEKEKKKAVFFCHVNSHLKEPEDKESNEHFLWYGNYMADELATASIKNIY